MSEGTQYHITIKMSPDTATKLHDHKFQLYGFKGFDGPVTSKPLVWFATDVYMDKTDVIWTEQYAAYASLQQLDAKTEVDGHAYRKITLGQVDTIGLGGDGTVSNGGIPGEISISNGVDTPFTAGVSVQDPIDKTYKPICAFDLFGGGLETVAPIEMVYFMFASTPVKEGKVIEQAFERGIQVDLTGGDTTAELTFDINKGWTGPGYATAHPANARLLPLLVNPGGQQRMSQRKARRFSLKAA